jgi:hypothetical protein
MSLYSTEEFRSRQTLMMGPQMVAETSVIFNRLASGSDVGGLEMVPKTR